MRMLCGYKMHFVVAVIIMLSGSANAQKAINDITIPGITHKLFWEIEPAFTEVRGNTLVIEAGEKTDMFRDPNVTYNTDNAPKLLFVPDEDFVLTTSISHDFLEKWDGGAIVFKRDSLNWVKFCFEKDYTGAHRVVSVVTRNVSDDCNSASVIGNKVYYKIAKAGNVITLYYSTTNKDWFLIRHFQLDKTDKWTVGFLAQSPLGKRCRVSFGDITYKHKKINDPYAGE